MSRDSVESNQRWVQRLRLPYPLLSDADAQAGHAFGITRQVGIGSWKLEFFRRATILIDMQGLVAAVWENVKVRGHAEDIIEVARALRRIGA